MWIKTQESEKGFSAGLIWGLRWDLLYFNWNHVLKLNPGDSYALQKLGQIDKRSGKKPQALAKYQLKHQAVSIRKGGSAAVVRHDGSAAAIYHKPDGTFGLAALRPCSGANGAGLFGVRSEVRTRVSADGRSIHIDHEVETRFRDMSLSDQSYLQLMPWRASR